MRRHSLLAALSAAAAVISASGCSGTATPPAPAGASLNSSGSRAPSARILSETPAGTTLVYVTDGGNGAIDAFTTAGKMVAQATGLFEPEGVGVAPNGDVYVTDTSASSLIVYSAGLKTDKQSLADNGEYPASVAISRDGEVAVGNIISTSDGPGSVSFYKAGADRPSRNVASASIQEVYFCAYDAKGTLWFDGRNNSGDSVLATIAKGSSKIKIVKITGGSIGFPGGVAVDANGKIIVGDQVAGVLYEITPQGKITGSVTLTGGNPGAFAFGNAASTTIWSETATGTGEWKFPAGGSPVTQWTSPAGELAVGKT